MRIVPKFRIVAALAAVLGLGGPALAQTTPGLGGDFDPFEVFGRLFSGTGDDGKGAPPVGDGWAQGGAAAGVLDDDGQATGSFNAMLAVDANWGNKGDGTDPSIFAGSNKNNQSIGIGDDPWECKSGGGGPQKNDLTNLYLHTRTDGPGGDLWVFVAAETRSTNGDSHVDFEFNQAGVLKIENQIFGSGDSGGRTDGDFIISVDFEQGGGNPSASIRCWDGDLQEFVEAGAGDNSGLILSATNSVDIEHSPGWGHFEGNGAPTSTLSALQLVEAGINLTGLGVVSDELRCSGAATFMIKTRSSQSFTAELKDFAIVDFPLEPTPVCEISGGTSPVCPGSTADFSVRETTDAEVETFEWSFAADGSNDARFVGPGAAADGATAVGTTVSVETSADCNSDFTLTVVAEGPVCSSAPCELKVSVDDTEDPVLEGVPADITVECDNIPLREDPTATDNCPDPSMAFSETSDLSECDGTGTIVRTWTATDLCGNNSTASQAITVVDTTAPVITCPPDVLNAVCDFTSPEFTGEATATDDCDDNPVVTFVDVRVDNVITRTWTATDCASNSVSCTQMIVEDCAPLCESSPPSRLVFHFDSLDDSIAQVTVSGEHPKGQLKIQNRSVEDGGLFAVSRTGRKGNNKLNPEITLQLTDSNETLVATFTIHTSCSQPLFIGQTFDQGAIRLTVVGGQ